MSISRKRKVRTALIAVASAGVLAGGSVVVVNAASAADRPNCPSTAPALAPSDTDPRVSVDEDNHIVGVADIYYPSRNGTGWHEYRTVNGGVLDGSRIPLVSQSNAFCTYADYYIYSIGEYNGSHSESIHTGPHSFRRARPFS